MKIKPCPFCGAEAEPHYIKEYSEHIYFVNHKEDCYLADNTFPENTKRVISMKHPGGICQNSSIEKWNTRTPIEERKSKLIQINDNL